MNAAAAVAVVPPYIYIYFFFNEISIIILIWFMYESCNLIGVEYQIIFVVVKCILVTFKIWKTLGDFITKTAEQKNVNKQFKIRR